jgi:polyisoprenoid-binding protein YceI
MALSGSYVVDPIHSSIRFKVGHGGVAFFRGYFEGVEGSLDADGPEPVLQGSTKVENISIRTPDIFRGHVLGEEFFDAANHPDISFRSTKAQFGDDGKVSLEGELTIRGNTKPITASGTWVGPSETHNGPRVALELESTVNRFDFGINWQSPQLPGGGPSLSDDVTMELTLQLAPAQ